MDPAMMKQAMEMMKNMPQDQVQGGGVVPRLLEEGGDRIEDEVCLKI